MFHDTVVNLIIVLMIVAMAVVWHATAGLMDAHHPEGQNGLLGALYEGKANPAVAGHRAAAGVVLPVPVRAPADLQVAVGADLRDDHHPDDPDGVAGRVAVPRPRPRQADLTSASRHGGRTQRAGRADRAHDRRRGGAGCGAGSNITGNPDYRLPARSGPDLVAWVCDVPQLRGGRGSVGPDLRMELRIPRRPLSRPRSRTAAGGCRRSRIRSTPERDPADRRFHRRPPNGHTAV